LVVEALELAYELGEGACCHSDGLALLEAEVVVVDSGSADRTQEIARQAGSSLVKFRWDGRYPKKRNWVLINHPLANE
jgi:glycosyltransferase involved in cell wall biosynthesis